MSDNDRPWEPPLAGTEADHLLGSLDRLRATFRWKADELGAAGLRTTVGASTLSLGGLLKHLAAAEDFYSTVQLSGDPMAGPWAALGWDGGNDWEFTSAAEDDPADLYDWYDGAVDRARRRLGDAVASNGLDHPVHVADATGLHASLRRLLCDLLEEYGRHTGHADLLREAVDGRVGEDPPPGWRHPVLGVRDEGVRDEGVRDEGVRDEGVRDGGQRDHKALAPRHLVGDDLRGATLERVDLTGSRFLAVDLQQSRFRGTDLNGAVMSGVELNGTRIDGEVDGLLVNGVDVGVLVEAELDRRDPDRTKMRPASPAEFAEAWDIVERRWELSVARARELDAALLHESVDGEWSFVETLRHLLFATDAWVGRVIGGDPSPWHPLDLPWDEMADREGIPRDRDVRPTLEEVLALRRDRLAGVRRLIEGLDAETLARPAAPVDAPGWPQGVDWPIGQCLWIVVNEEWQHRVYAERDLTVLESGGAGRG